LFNIVDESDVVKHLMASVIAAELLAVFTEQFRLATILHTDEPYVT
jgi:hypothetical protein